MNDPINAEIVESQALAVRPISGLPTVQDLEQQFDLAIRQRELLSEYIKKQLVPGKHFYQRGTQKPSLAKEGAEIILLPHNLAPDYEQTGGPDAPPADGKPYQITVKCTLRRKGDPSSFVGSGIGSAGSEKQKKDGTYIHRQEDKYLCHNATLKMAQKSAMIAATINSTAASEFFTQDIEEAEKPEPPQPPPQPKPAVTSRFPTEVHRAKMIANLKAGPGDDNREIATEYFRKCDQLLPTEELEDLPLRFVPATKEEMNDLASLIMGFSCGGRAAPAFDPHEEPDKPKTSKKSVKVESSSQDSIEPPGGWQGAAGEHLGKCLHGQIAFVSVKTGKSKKGNPWTLYGIKIGEQWVNSFDTRIGESAKEFAEGDAVTLYYEEDDKGKKATCLVLPDGTRIESED